MCCAHARTRQAYDVTPSRAAASSRPALLRGRPGPSQPGANLNDSVYREIVAVYRVKEGQMLQWQWHAVLGVVC